MFLTRFRDERCNLQLQYNLNLLRYTGVKMDAEKFFSPSVIFP